MHYLGTYDGVSNGSIPASAQGGDYFAVSTAGTVTVAGTTTSFAVNVADVLVWTTPTLPTGPVACWQQSSLALMALPDLASYLPDFFQPLQEYQALLVAEQVSCSQLQQDLLQLAANQYVQTCDMPTLMQHEDIFNIQGNPDPAVESLQFRRLRVLNRYAAQPPFTLLYLGSVLQMFFGVAWWLNLGSMGTYHYKLGSWQLGVFPFFSNSNLTLTASFPNAPFAAYNEIISTIQTMLPCHIVFVYEPYISSTSPVPPSTGTTLTGQSFI